MSTAFHREPGEWAAIVDVLDRRQARPYRTGEVGPSPAPYEVIAAAMSA